MPGMSLSWMILLLLLLLPPGVDHDVLGDLRVAGVGRDVEGGPAVPVGEVGVGSEPDHKSDDL